jgi:hypothetical protein
VLSHAPPGLFYSGQSESEGSNHNFSHVDVRRVILRYQNDPDNRLTNRWSTAKGNTVYAYDPVGNLTNTAYPVSNPVSFQYDSLVWSIIAFELTMPFALFSGKPRKFAIVIGFFFHLSIALLLNIPEFMNGVCAYVLFVKPEAVQKRFQKIRSAIPWSSLSHHAGGPPRKEAPVRASVKM